MIDVALDFETFFDQDYSLKKMQNAEYVMDSRFESIGFSIKVGVFPVKWITGTFEHQKKCLSHIPWDKARLIAHNARFDGSILEWRFGFKPAQYLCTMVGSRPHFVPKTGSMSLEKISAHLGFPPKGNTVHAMLGRHRDDLSAQELRDYGDYCARDTDNAWMIANELVKVLPEEELRLIDLTLKKYIRPALRLDGHKLLARIQEVHQERRVMLEGIHAKYGVTRAMLASRTQFANVLSQYGADIPMKPTSKNAKKQGMTYAFAKNDAAFQQLLVYSHRAEVRELIQAKLMISSTQEQARLARLLSLHNTMNGYLPVPLVYYGAHTGRFSGDESINLQNLPRVEWKDGKLIKGQLRYCVVARPGYQIIAADFSNIEARLVATLAGQEDLILGFKNGEDIYSSFATDIYGYKVTKNTHPMERFVGKCVILSLGYGMGWERFLLRMRQEGLPFDEKEAKRVVYLYRERYSKIPALWKTLDHLAEQYLPNRTSLHVWKELTFMYERILLPNGMPIQYPDIAYSRDQQRLLFRSRNHQIIGAQTLLEEHGKSIWGGTFLENISQGLARIIATRAELKLSTFNLPVVLQVHDELVFHVPEPIVEVCKKAISHAMTMRVDWMPDLPINVDIKSGPSYGECK